MKIKTFDNFITEAKLEYSRNSDIEDVSAYVHEQDSVYLVMTDGGLFDTQNIIKFKHFSERVLFCITDNDIKNTLKNKGSYLSW